MSDVMLRDSLSRNGTRHGDVSYVTLALPDAAAGRRFYATVLGWGFDPDGHQVDAVVPQVGMWPGSAWRPGVQAGPILAWRVDDITTAVDAVRAAGGTATDVVEQPYGLEAECTDGRGLRFWLHQLPAAGEPAPPNGERQGDVSYVVLRVADLGRAEGFFSSVLGWAFQPGRVGVHVDGPVPMTGMSQGEPGVTLCYRTDDIAAAAERVVEAGGTATAPERRDWGGLESECTDDQGVAFILHQL